MVDTSVRNVVSYRLRHAFNVINTPFPATRFARRSDKDQEPINIKYQEAKGDKLIQLKVLKEENKRLMELQNPKLMEELGVKVEELEPKPTDTESKNKALNALKEQRESSYIELTCLWELGAISEDVKKAFEEKLEAAGKLKPAGQALLKAEKAKLLTAGIKREKVADADIKLAVKLWFAGRESAEVIYGPIPDWNVSEVTDMAKLFSIERNSAAKNFNEDISI